MTRRGFPHSETPGSKLVCSSPGIFAAYCVLHRLLAPRHSPYALSSLTIGMELTPAAASRRPHAPERAPDLRLPMTRDSPSSHPHLKTLRVFVDRKNYRLQDIQLSKNRRRPVRTGRPVKPVGTAAGARCALRLARSLHGPQTSCERNWWRIPGSNR